MTQAYIDQTRVEQDYEVFRSKGFSPKWVITGVKNQHVLMDNLPPFLRTLLITDGTVTKSLEAYYWEPVAVRTVVQEVVRASSALAWLGLAAGDEVLERSVDLQGEVSQRVYAKAFSRIRLGCLPETIRASLLAGRLGIGELIRDCGLETYRQLLEIGLKDEEPRAGRPPEHVFRTYRITLNREPTILVTECFPVALFHSPKRAQRRRLDAPLG